ncbi:MAG: hypothetical protein QOD71_1131 [Thermoleophilaceae bacterium]|jgi:hypothetical protein|nr:hypothetical protein [Thermoleophilaceae bacterium]
MSWVARRLKPYLGLEVVAHGILDSAEAGHPAGTAYVIISAESALDRDKARKMLESLSGLTDLAWDYGWVGRAQPGGRQVTELKLFPGEPVPAQPSSSEAI